jgi:hypothetical protein
LLKADATGIMRPSSDSPARGHATETYGIAADMDGNARKSSSSDAGADEFSSVGTVPPISACDVGPLSWKIGPCSALRPKAPATFSVR